MITKSFNGVFVLTNYRCFSALANDGSLLDITSNLRHLSFTPALLSAKLNWSFANKSPSQILDRSWTTKEMWMLMNANTCMLLSEINKLHLHYTVCKRIIQSGGFVYLAYCTLSCLLHGIHILKKY